MARFKFEVVGLGRELRVLRFEGTEAMSELFELGLWLVSEEPLRFSEVVGKAALLTVEADESAPRHIHGIVSRFREAEEGKKHVTYQAVLVPSLWRLTHRRGSRIFQELTVPEIIERVLKDAGWSSRDYRLSLIEAHPKREYCVQYRESDFALISRLMEEEGIFYFFEHTEDGHVLVLCDSVTALEPIAGPEAVAYRPSLGAMASEEAVSRFAYAEEVRPGKVTLSDFNFTKPSLSLLSSAQADVDTDLEVYDHPGEYELPGDGDKLSRVRLEESQVLRQSGDGETTCIRFVPGYRFLLDDHPRDEHNQAYLLTRVEHRGVQAAMGESAGEGEPGYRITFRCIPTGVPFRPERRTPRPTIKGVQTAVVTGGAGEEIHTDRHGRVKVQFHWDRQGKRDERSSCWIRVSQIWAGPGFGAMYIPRVGHEVVVDFIEGDPDRPIIVGRVYHGANVPPYPLPGEKTKSTLKSSSSPGGGGSNELRFEDRAGAEEIYLHGQKDYAIKIENDKGQAIGRDESLDVGRDRSKHVGQHQRETVDGNQSIQVGGDHTENIDGHQTIHVGKDHTESVDGKESINIGKTREVTVASDQTTSIGGNHTVTVGKSHDETIVIAMTLNVGAAKMENVGAASSENVGAAKSLVVGAAYDVKVGGAMSTAVAGTQSTRVGGNQSVQVGGSQTTVAGKKIVITCGNASISIDKSGNITVSGKNIGIAGTGPISIKGKKLNVKSDGAVTVQASGAVKIKGSKVGIN